MTDLHSPALRWSVLPIPALLLLMAVLHVTVDPAAFYDPPWLILIGNTLFVGVVGFAVAGIAWRCYATTGRVQVLLLGCAMLVSGMGGVLAAWVRALPDGANLTVTIHNTGALVSAVLHFVAALVLSAGVVSEIGLARRKSWLKLAYGGTALLLALLTAASFKGAIPPFFIQGVGPTPLRQQVLGAAGWLFVFSFFMFMATYFRNHERFLYWYAGGLALTAINLFAVFIQQSVGSPVGWVGRGALYLGGIYFLVSLVVAGRSAQQRGRSFDDVLSASLTGVEEKFRAAFTNAAVGFLMATPAGRYMDANPAFCALTGYSLVELRTLDFPLLVHPDDRAANLVQTQRMLAGEIPDFTVESRYVCKGDQLVWVRESVSLVRDPQGKPRWIMALVEDITERKEAGERLRENEEKYRNLFLNMAEEVHLWQLVRDDAGRIETWRLVDANPPTLATWGRLSVDEIRGKTTDEIFGPGATEHYLPIVQKIFTANAPHSFEDYFPKLDRYFRFTSVPFGAYFITTGADITAIKKAELALRESEARLKKVLEVETVGVMFWDLTTGRMIDANDTFLAMMGYSRREVEARELTWQNLTPPEYVEASLAEIRKFQATGRVGPYEKEYFCKDGTRKWLIFAGSSLGDDTCVEFCVDIVDRKRAEDALRQSEARLQSEAVALARLNEASSRLWTVRDLRLGLDEVLAAAIDLLGADMGTVQLLDAKGDVLEFAAHRGFTPDYLDFFREVSASADTSSGRALRSRRRIVIEDVETDSAFAPYRPVARAAGYRAVQSTPLIGHDDRPLGMISTHFRSVHRPSEEELRRFDLYARQAADFVGRCRMDEALRQAEEQRQILQAELFRASRLSEIGKMAAALAHELNQPLTAVVTYIGGCRRILASDTQDEQRKRKVQDVMEQASVQALRAGEIIRRLREFIGSGERERRIEDAAAVMREACTLAVTTARLDGAAVRSDIDRTGHILVDKIQFQQVIVNLTRNAVEAMEGSLRKELAFGLTTRDDRIEVSVSDTGRGVDPDIVDRLFKPFSTTKSGGMGIGLSVCREIVEAHEGRIWMEPNPAGGTVFRFTLPIIAEHMVASPAMAAPAELH
jgi:PAS domain S-box-containing protein